MPRKPQIFTAIVNKKSTTLLILESLLDFIKMLPTYVLADNRAGRLLAACFVGLMVIAIEVGRNMAKKPLISSQTLKLSMLGLCGLFGFTFGVMGDAVDLIPDWVLAVVAVLIAGSSFYYWRRLDETAREAHKFSWYWGSTLGVCLGLSIWLLSYVGLDMITPLVSNYGARAEPVELFMLGILSVLTIQAFGYFLVWAFWWLRMR